MSLIIVTPIHNEEANIGVLAEQIAESTLKPDLWIVVDDGSTDRGAEMIRAMEHPMETVRTQARQCRRADRRIGLHRVAVRCRLCNRTAAEFRIRHEA
ncbi:glycosyltransferase [Rhodococcus hoagii]|nr:glycosyltransferase [Prescottella equi]